MVYPDRGVEASSKRACANYKGLCTEFLSNLMMEERGGDIEEICELGKRGIHSHRSMIIHGFGCILLIEAVHRESKTPIDRDLACAQRHYRIAVKAGGTTKGPMVSCELFTCFG